MGKRILFVVGFTVSVLLSVLIFLGEITLLLKIKVFPLSYLSEATDLIDTFDLLSLITLIYMFVACLILFFELKVKGFFMVERHQTDSVSFLFIGGMMAKIGIPLCYNFAQLLKLEKDLVISKFINGGVSNNFAGKIQSFLPIIMLVFVGFKVFNVYDKLLNFVGFRTINFNNEETEEVIRNGKKMLQKS